MISVIVPYKDAEQWIGRCCESLARQDGDFEFLIINDRSEDSGPDIVMSYAKMDSRFRQMDNRRGAGVSGARNTGLDAAAGEHITFLDADDEMLPDAFRTFTEVIRDGANIYQFNHLRYYTRIRKEVLKYTNDGGIITLPDLPVHWFGVWNKLFNADFLRDVRFDEELQYGEDGLFVLGCLRKDGRIFHARKNATTVRHRFDNAGSLTKVKGRPDVLKYLDKYRKLLDTDASEDLKRAVCMELSRLWSTLAEDYTGAE
jgi:glycosyltransferase involved in cell wall biosynthesis